MPCMAGRFFTTEPPGKPYSNKCNNNNNSCSTYHIASLSTNLCDLPSLQQGYEMWFCSHFKDEGTGAQGDAVSSLGQPVNEAASLSEMFPVFVLLPSAREEGAERGRWEVVGRGRDLRAGLRWALPRSCLLPHSCPCRSAGLRQALPRSCLLPHSCPRRSTWLKPCCGKRAAVWQVFLLSASVNGFLVTCVILVVILLTLELLIDIKLLQCE